MRFPFSLPKSSHFRHVTLFILIGSSLSVPYFVSNPTGRPRSTRKSNGPPSWLQSCVSSRSVTRPIVGSGLCAALDTALPKVQLILPRLLCCGYADARYSLRLHHADNHPRVRHAACQSHACERCSRSRHVRASAWPRSWQRRISRIQNTGSGTHRPRTTWQTDPRGALELERHHPPM